MGLKFEVGKVYEMPVFFGPSPAPKNPGADGEYPLKQPATVEAATVMYRTDPEMLERFLPEGFSLAAPVLSVAACEFGTLGNFAGNTYYLINISTPVRFDGERDHVRGDLVLAMYENHADPILGGRDLMGYAKIYADIARFAKDKGHVRTHASDWDFRFLDIDVDTTAPCPDKQEMRRLAAESKGKLNYKYIQATPEKGAMAADAGADCSYPTMNPTTWEKPDDYPYDLMQPERIYCSGSVEWHMPTADDMPMYWHVPVALAALPNLGTIGASFARYQDPTDYNHVWRLR